MKKTAIITAMREEANHIIALYQLTESKNLQNITLYENEDIVLALTGIGKIQASIATTFLFLNYDFKKIINIGISGSLLGQNASIGDVFLVNKISQHDMYLPFDGPHLDYAKKEIVIHNDIDLDFKDLNFCVTKNAHCLTGDQFIDDDKKVSELSIKYYADVIEMEAFSIASVAREFGSLEKCTFIKAISDGANNKAKNEHMGNLDYAMQNSIRVLEKILSK